MQNILQISHHFTNQITFLLLFSPFIILKSEKIDRSFVIFQPDRNSCKSLMVWLLLRHTFWIVHWFWAGLEINPDGLLQHETGFLFLSKLPRQTNIGKHWNVNKQFIILKYQWWEDVPWNSEKTVKNGRRGLSIIHEVQQWHQHQVLTNQITLSLLNKAYFTLIKTWPVFNLS